MYDAFATSAACVQLPGWFYSAWAIAGLAPFVKAELTPEQRRAGVEPDVRPIAAGEVSLRAITHHLAEGVLSPAAEILSPQQVAVGVSGGGSILGHGTRMTMEAHPGFVVVRTDTHPVCATATIPSVDQ